MVQLHFYNDVNAMRAVIGRCPWSIRVRIRGCRHGKLLFFVLVNMARGFENFYEIILDLSKWKPRKKNLQELFTKKKNGETEIKFKRAIYNLKMPKLQEIFTTVAIVCHHY